ncbi:MULTISPECIES: hypothetical protein [unclassified Devosia]|uniref:hypothetical protein n=1 Tax=unclassified Devosia TaxID=196773 RepID=UPI00145CC107|nr:MULTISPECIES: hypothetical protein [unclassified Devosia]MBJ6986825.1 hypothetical protein [Devosia sp. MC521]QMW63858.1 hypothetical protein H4N61_05925 [Devosia sp. MC521]
MLFPAPNHGLYIRIVALFTLALGLSDAARLLGVSTVGVSPMEHMGATAFTYLGGFCIARLFAAVGLWLKSSWGAVLVVAATVFELALYLSGNPDVRMSMAGFFVRILLLLAIVLIFALTLRLKRAAAD